MPTLPAIVARLRTHLTVLQLFRLHTGRKAPLADGFTSLPAIARLSTDPAWLHDPGTHPDADVWRTARARIEEVWMPGHLESFREVVADAYAVPVQVGVPYDVPITGSVVLADLAAREWLDSLVPLAAGERRYDPGCLNCGTTAADVWALCPDCASWMPTWWGGLDG